MWTSRNMWWKKKKIVKTSCLFRDRSHNKNRKRNSENIPKHFDFEKKFDSLWMFISKNVSSRRVISLMFLWYIYLYLHLHLILSCYNVHITHDDGVNSFHLDCWIIQSLIRVKYARRYRVFAHYNILWWEAVKGLEKISSGESLFEFLKLLESDSILRFVA